MVGSLGTLGMELKRLGYSLYDKSRRIHKKEKNIPSAVTSKSRRAGVTSGFSTRVGQCPVQLFLSLSLASVSGSEYEEINLIC